MIKSKSLVKNACSLFVMLAVGACMVTWVPSSLASSAPAAAEIGADGKVKNDSPPAPGIIQVITHSGPTGVFLWILLLACSLAMAWLIIDSFMTISKAKIAPVTLIKSVQEAMAVGDLMKAINYCKEKPTPLANILMAGFTHVEDGFEVIQESVSVQAEVETERMLHRVSYMNVIANVAPMLGLIGTVQGMIAAFTTMATSQAGAAQQATLALNIGEGLWATAVGLGQTVPAMIFFQFFKNRANSLALHMEQVTVESIKVLRNAEVEVEK